MNRLSPAARRAGKLVLAASVIDGQRREETRTIEGATLLRCTDAEKA